MPSYSNGAVPVGQPIPLHQVDVNPANPRKHYREIDSLADNIQQFGLLQPITVRRVGDRYELIGGHRRRMAYLLLNEREPDNEAWQTIRAEVQEADDDRALALLLSSQIHTHNWTSREEASVLEHYAQQGMSQKQIAQKVNRTEGWISKRLRVYADSVLSGYVQTGRLSASVAEEFLSIADVRTRKRIAEQAVKGNWSKEDARTQAQRLRVDRQVGELERLTRTLIDALSSMDPVQVPIDLMRDLQTLRGRVEMLADQREPVVAGRRKKKVAT